MLVSQITENTPRYVLLGAGEPVGPACVSAPGGVSCAAFYGFHDRVAYDRFCSASPESLRPYPLVGGFLKNRLGGSDGVVRLVVLDAPGPEAPHLCAATVDEVNSAQNDRSLQVRATFVLNRNDATGAYTAEALPG